MKKLLVTVIGSAVAFAASAELGPGVWFNEFARGTNTVDELVASSGSYWSELENSTNTYVVEAMGTYTTGAGFPKETAHGVDLQIQDIPPRQQRGQGLSVGYRHGIRQVDPPDDQKQHERYDKDHVAEDKILLQMSVKQFSLFVVRHD